MTFDLLSMSELTASAAIVVLGFAWLFGKTPGERLSIAALFCLWFVFILWAGASRLLYYDGPIGVPGLGLVVVLPIALLSLVGFGTAWGRARIRDASMPGMIAIHTVRLLGVSFILLQTAGRLPAPFAPSAGWGDIAVGASALPLAWWIMRRPAPVATAVWSWFGLADLVLAVALGATSSPGPIRLFLEDPGSAIMTTLPWILIPCFLVPILSFVHLATLYRLSGSAQRSRVRSEAAAMG